MKEEDGPYINSVETTVQLLSVLWALVNVIDIEELYPYLMDFRVSMVASHTKHLTLRYLLSGHDMKMTTTISMSISTQVWYIVTGG